MKTVTFTLLLTFIASLSLTAQGVRPVFFFGDATGLKSTHNMHITSDGQFYYTCIGGAKNDVTSGKISKYSLTGELVESYSFKNFDMRSIMYNSKDKQLYIATKEVKTKDAKIYKIIDLKSGTTQLMSNLTYKNPQSAIAMDPDGKTYYAMDGGTLTIHKIKKDGTITKTISGLSFGADNKDDPDTPAGRFGSTAVAVDKNYIYTWDAHSGAKKIYAYDKKGNFIRSFDITTGNYGFSLSFANGYVFVAVDGAGKIGTWNGYKLWDSK
ncbi:MAG: hypothetical protein WCJ26_02195 [bacterium]